MRQKPTPRTTALGLLAGFILLAIALNGLSLGTGLRIELSRKPPTDSAFTLHDANPERNYQSHVVGWIVSAVVALGVVLFFVSLISKRERISALVLLIVGAAVITGISLIPRSSGPLISPFDSGAALPGSSDDASTIVDPMAAEDAVDVSVAPTGAKSVLSWVLAAAGIAGLVVIVGPRLWRRPKDDEPTVEVEHRVLEAVRDVERGDEVLAVVIRCYREMLQAFGAGRSVGKRDALTPRELVEKLVGNGVDRLHAEGLTSLFERARYGSVVLAPAEEEAAVEHLRAIATTLGRAETAPRA